MNEWEFWRLVNHNSNILIYEDKLSFEDMQKFNAVLDMAEDYERAVQEYYKEINKINPA